MMDERLLGERLAALAAARNLDVTALSRVDPWELAFGGATEVEPDDSRLGGVGRALSELQTQVDHLQATIREAARKGAGPCCHCWIPGGRAGGRVGGQGVSRETMKPRQTLGLTGFGVG